MDNPNTIRKYNLSSKTDYPISIKYVGSPLTKITAYIGESKFVFDTPQFNENGINIIAIPAQAFNKIGSYKVYIVPSNNDGDGNPIQTNIYCVDEIYVGVPDLRNITYPIELTGADYSGTNVDFNIEYESENTDFV